MIRIPLPRHIDLDNHQQLRAHAEWYLREVCRYGPDVHAQREQRRARRRRRLRQQHARSTGAKLTDLASPSGSVR